MKAWIVYDKDNENTIITWADTRGKAKCKLLYKNDVFDLKYTDIRAKRFKEYDDRTKVSIVELLDKGWWFSCQECGKQISIDMIKEKKAFLTKEDNDTGIDGGVICLECKNKKNSWFQYIFRSLSC